MVLAEFGDEKITSGDLDRELEKLPASARESIDTAEKKSQFLRNLIAERLLVDKARRLELDKDEAVQDALAKQLDALIVRKLIDDEVAARLTMTPEDVERFYKAEIARFTSPNSATGTLAQGATEPEARAALTGAALRQAQGERGGEAQGERGQVSITADSFSGAELPEESVARLQEAVLNGPAGAVEMAVETGGLWIAFKGTHTPETVTPLEEVRDQVERMYRMQKEQELVNGLIQETLEARNVKIYEERLKEGAK